VLSSLGNSEESEIFERFEKKIRKVLGKRVFYDKKKV